MCTCVREWKSLSTCLLICLSTCLSVRLPVCSSVCLSHRQQIEDCETEIQRLKELLKKREENERKYHGQLQAFLHPRPSHSAFVFPTASEHEYTGKSCE